MSPRERTDRRNRIARIGVAALAFLGIGAAITTAAWTDEVWYSGDASTGTFDLQGSTVDGDTWEDGRPPQDAITLPVSIDDIGLLVPGQTYTATVYVYNAGTVPAALTATVETNGLSDYGVTVTPTLGDAVLGAKESTAVTVTLDTTNLDDDGQSETGAITVRVTGSSDIP